MQEWAQGYVTDVPYVHDYYPELNPCRAQFALLQRGWIAPDIQHACELGFGQGISVNMHAAAGSARWYGNDFNPAQAALARELATASGAAASLSDDSFAEFCMRKDLPDFDFIAMHGVWTWVSDANRRLLVDFVNRRLKPGGVLYLSWNSLAGWAPFLPLRGLLLAQKERWSATGDSTLRHIESALEFSQQLLQATPAYLQRNPGVFERLQLLQKQHKGYVAHEFFNRDWQPMDFAELSRWLEPARLSFAAAANIVDEIPDLNHTPEQQGLLAAIDDVALRQTAGDLMCSRFFRRDYWIRGARVLGAQARLRALRDYQAVLLVAPGEVSYRIEAGVGQVRLPERIFLPVLEQLADRQLHRVDALEASLQPAGILLEQLVEAIAVLHSQGHVALIKSSAGLQEARVRCQRLNDHLLQRAVDGSEIAHLASPLTGGGVGVNRFQQLFLLAMQHGHEDPAQWAEFAWQVASTQHLRIRKEDRLLETPDEIRSELLRQASSFVVRELPVLKVLEAMPSLAP